MVETEPQHAPPGWYPDPGGSDQQRWWDGERWTERLQPPPIWTPEPPKGSKPASPWAVAALVFGIVGAFVLAIVVGLIARKKIRESDGRLGGENLALAGIVLGAAWGVVGLTVLSLSSSGAFDTENRDDYTGARQPIALVVDRLEAALDEDDGETACRELLTPAFQRRLADGPQRSCPAAIEDAVPDDTVQVDLDVRRITITGDRADVEVEEDDDRQRWRLLRDRQGRWRVDGIT